MITGNATTEQIASTLTALRGSGINAETEVGIWQILGAMTGILNSQDLEGWKTVFGLLGDLHSGVNRYNLVRAVLMSWTTVTEVQQWGPSWLRAMETGGIHPISLCLCAAKSTPELRESLLAIYTATFGGGYPRSPKLASGSFLCERDRHWDLELPAGVLVTNVVSSHPIHVRESHWGAQTAIAEGWCVRELLVREMPNLKSLGPNLVVMTDLNLMLAPGVQTLETGCRIGGKTKVWKSNAPDGTIQDKDLPKGDWRNDLSWEEAGDQYVSNGFGYFIGPYLFDDSIDSIQFPNSWQLLIDGDWKAYDI